MKIAGAISLLFLSLAVAQECAIDDVFVQTGHVSENAAIVMARCYTEEYSHVTMTYAAADKRNAFPENQGSSTTPNMNTV
jgi:hypothetical protein